MTEGFVDRDAQGRVVGEYRFGGVYQALALAAGAMKAIDKDQTNQAQGFKFRSIESIVAAAKPLLYENDLAIIPTGFELLSSEQVQSSGGTRGYRSTVRGHWTIAHADGSRMDASMLGEAVDYGDKSVSKAVQMAYKYLLTQLLGIGSEDPDAHSPEMMADTSTKRRTNALKAKAAEAFDAEAGEVWAQVMEELGIDTPDEVPTDKLAAVEARLGILAVERRAGE
jgi:hypothetical protein